MSGDVDNQQNGGGDSPPVVEEFASVSRIVKWVSESDPFGRAGEPKYAPEDGHDFRPVLRPPVPVLTVLDDGSLEQGEDVRLRREQCSIGRSRAAPIAVEIQPRPASRRPPPEPAKRSRSCA